MGVPSRAEASSDRRPLTTRIFSSGSSRRKMDTAASVSSVGTSPAQAITTSARRRDRYWPTPQMPMPLVQCNTARSMLSHCGAGCLPATHDVHVVPAAQAMVHHREQAIGVGRQVHPHDFRLFVDHVIDEARILMGEAVVILAPDVGRQDVIQRRDARAQARPRVIFSHFACWLNIESMM